MAERGFYKNRRDCYSLGNTSPTLSQKQERQLPSQSATKNCLRKRLLPYRHLDDAVELVLEEVVCLGDVGQFVAVGNER